MSRVWRDDLTANSGRKGLIGALTGWYLNPGFAVMTLHRWSHAGLKRGGPFGNLLSKWAWRRIVGYGCYFDPKARLGRGIRLPHPTGIVVGSGTTIGDGCTIYQNVTFGRRNAALEYYPQLGRNVTVYSGATLIGGITVGDDAIIGAHALVAEDVPAGAKIYSVRARPHADGAFSGAP